MRALCYSGNLRTFEHCVKNHLAVFGECDVYLSIWDTWGYVDRINDPWHLLKEGRRSGIININTVKSLIPEGFNVKKIKIDSYDKIIIPGEMRRNNYLLWQYYKILDCFGLVSGSYDEIVRMRCDITLERFNFVPGKLNCSSYVWYNEKAEGRMNEMIFAGDYDTMSKACSIINNIPVIQDILPDYLLYGESIFGEHLKLENINVSFQDFGWRVLR
jgi:hypothetical protein